MYISGNDRSIKKAQEYNILKYCSKNLLIHTNTNTNTNYFIKPLTV